jgi:DNA-binding MarR family transcriptional regulator
MLDKMSNASRLVEKLRQKDYVERKECKEDRRSVDVKITDHGLAILKAINQQGMVENEILREKIDEEEAQALNNILDKIRS